MRELKERFAELERLPAPDLQQLIQTRVQRLQQPGRLKTGAERAWRHFERPRLLTAWTTQVLAAAVIVALAIGLALIFHYARTVGPARPTPIPTTTRASVDPSNCRFPVVVNSGAQLKTEAGFVDTRSGHYTKDGSASVAGLPVGGNSDGTSFKPWQPAAPAWYSDALRRWIPVLGGAGLAPDGRSYLWVVRLFHSLPSQPEGSSSPNFQKEELHRYDVASATDRTLWTYAGMISILRWDASGILVQTGPDPPKSGGPLWWRVDPRTGTADRTDAPAGSFFATLPDDPNEVGGLGTDSQGRKVFRLGSPTLVAPEWVFFETAPGQRVTIYRGKQGDATGFDPGPAMGDATGIWFGASSGDPTLWHWQQGTGLHKLTLTGLPGSANSTVYVDPAGPCL
jgi:hypothetical protein